MTTAVKQSNHPCDDPRDCQRHVEFHAVRTGRADDLPAGVDRFREGNEDSPGFVGSHEEVSFTDELVRSVQFYRGGSAGNAATPFTATFG
jgi:hypothetical protein